MEREKKEEPRNIHSHALERGNGVDKKVEEGSLYRNSVSYFGGLIILVSIVMILLFLLLSFSLRAPSPYLGILTYMIFPGFLTMGILVFLYGLFRESHRDVASARQRHCPILRSI